VAEAKGDWKTAVLCGYYLGARLGDVVKLCWEDINFASGEVGAIAFRQSKTGKRVLIPLVPELREHLESIARDEMDPYIMPTLALRRPGGRNGLSGTFIRILEKTGIDPRYVEGKGKRFAKLSFHSLRHTFNSAMANAGVSQEVRMKLTGHQSGAMNNAYTHHEQRTYADALNRIPRLFD
jgi:integrase